MHQYDQFKARTRHCSPQSSGLTSFPALFKSGQPPNWGSNIPQRHQTYPLKERSKLGLPSSLPHSPSYLPAPLHFPEYIFLCVFYCGLCFLASNKSLSLLVDPACSAGDFPHCHLVCSKLFLIFSLLPDRENKPEHDH